MIQSCFVCYPSILIVLLRFYNLLSSVCTLLVYKHCRFTCLQTLYFQSVYSRVAVALYRSAVECGPSEWGLRWFESSDRTILVLPFSQFLSMSITLDLTASGSGAGRPNFFGFLYSDVPIHKVVGLERVTDLNFFRKSSYGPPI